MEAAAHQKELARANEELAKNNLSAAATAKSAMIPTEERGISNKRKRSEEEAIGPAENCTKEKKHEKDKSATEADTIEDGAENKKEKKHKNPQE